MPTYVKEIFPANSCTEIKYYKVISLSESTNLWLIPYWKQAFQDGFFTKTSYFQMILLLNPVIPVDSCTKATVVISSWFLHWI
jgi:hypothetical protein